MSSSDLFDWRGYPKGTFFKLPPLCYKDRVFAIVNKNYVYSLESKKNVQITWSLANTEDVTILGYVPQDFFK